MLRVPVELGPEGVDLLVREVLVLHLALLDDVLLRVAAGEALRTREDSVVRQRTTRSGGRRTSNGGGGGGGSGGCLPWHCAPQRTCRPSPRNSQTHYLRGTSNPRSSPESRPECQAFGRQNGQEESWPEKLTKLTRRREGASQSISFELSSSSVSMSSLNSSSVMSIPRLRTPFLNSCCDTVPSAFSSNERKSVLPRKTRKCADQRRNDSSKA